MFGISSKNNRRIGPFWRVGILLSANHCPRLRSTQNRRIEHFLHHKPAPFASGSGLLERSSTLPSRDLWSKRNFVRVIAMLLTAHTSQGVPILKCLSCWYEQDNIQIKSVSVQWTNSRVAFYLLFGNHSLTSYSTSSRTWITLSHQPTTRNACSVPRVSLVAVSGLRNAAIPLSGLTLLRWKQHTIGGIDASNMTVCV